MPNQPKKKKRFMRDNKKTRRQSSPMNIDPDSMLNPSDGLLDSTLKPSDGLLEPTLQSVGKAAMNEYWESFGFNPPNEQEIRTFIKVLWFYEFNCPTKEEWRGDGGIMPHLRDKYGIDPRVTANALEKISEGEEATRKEGSGRKHKLQDDNDGFINAIMAINCGMSPAMATCICNSTNRENNKDMPDADFKKEFQVCRNTLMNNIYHYADVEERAVPAVKTGGDKGPNSKWAKSRVVLCTMYQAQEKAGDEWMAGNQSAKLIADLYAKYGVHPLVRCALVQMDEVHTDAALTGSTTSTHSKRQIKISFDKETGKPAKKSAGGVMPADKVRAVAKYASQAKCMLMVACPKDEQGNEFAQMLETWWYTHQWVLSIEDWDAKELIEFEYRRKMDSMGWGPYKDANPYLQRYGPGAPDCPQDATADGRNPETEELYWKEFLRNSSGKERGSNRGDGLKKYV